MNGDATWTFNHVAGTIAASGGAVAAWFAVAGWNQARRGRRDDQRRWEADTQPAVTAVLVGPGVGGQTFTVKLTNAGGAARPATVVVHDQGRLFAGSTHLVAHAPTSTAALVPIGQWPHGGVRRQLLCWARDAQGIWWDMTTQQPADNPPADDSPDANWLRFRVLADPEVASC